MKYLVIVATLFVLGSLFGYGLEVLYRRFVAQKKWMNPGFLVGPYLPIYGTGVVVLFAISNVSFSTGTEALDVAIRILAIGVMMTLIEFIAGLVFIRGLKIKLWDYSNCKGNIMGVICPLYSLIWLVVGSLYYFFLNPLLIGAIDFISENLIYSFFVGAVIGMMIVDFAYSLHLGLRLKRFKEYNDMRFEELKKLFREKRAKLLSRPSDGAETNGN